MNIGFFSEAGYEGKVPRNHPNMRTEFAQMCALDATHHPLYDIDKIDKNFLPNKNAIFITRPDRNLNLLIQLKIHMQFQMILD